MIVRRFICSLLLIGWWLGSGSNLPAQIQDIPREEDERAATVVERESLLSVLVAKAASHRKTGENVQAARLLNRAARLQAKLHKPDDALATYREVLELIHDRDSSAEIDSLNGTAAIYAGASKCRQSIAAVQRALALSEQSNYVAGRAEGLLVLSDCENHKDHALALQTARQALDLWQSINNRWGIAKTYMAIGDYQVSLNDLISATQSLEASLNIWTELNIPVEKAESLISLGFIEYRRGAWQDSILLLSQAEALLDEKAEPYRMGQITGGLAEAFIEVGLAETGLEKLKLAKEYFRQANSPRALVVMFWDEGRANYQLGNYTEAIENLTTGFIDGQSLQEPMFAALCAEHLGRTYAALNENERALTYYRWALHQYQAVSSPMEEARTAALIGQLYQRQGKVEQSREQYQRSLIVFQRLDDHLNESATLYALGVLELQQNNLDIAEGYLRRSIEATEGIRRVSTSSDLTAAFSATVHDRYQTHIDCLMRQRDKEPGRKLEVQAFETSELARGRALAELLRATQTNLVPGLDPQLGEREKVIRQSLKAKEDYKIQLLGTKYKKEELDALQREVDRLETELKALSESIKAHYPAYDQLTRPAAWNLGQIQKQLLSDDQTVILEYSFGAENSYVWAVTKTGLSSYKLPPEEQIVSAVRRVYDLLKNAPGPEQVTAVKDATQKLGAMILTPVAAELKQRRRIIVVADGALNYIPFQILPAPFANNQPLVADYEIINAPSASILGQLQQEATRRRAPEKVLAAFGDPVFPSNYPQFRNAINGNQPAAAQMLDDYRWGSAVRDIEPDADSLDPTKIQPLFYARRELANLRDVAGDKTLVATGFDASRERLESVDLTGYAIVHFATHGILNSKRPERSGLLLSMVGPDGKSRDGFLRLSDVYQLHIPVNLVVLSACRTGLGKDVRGEGLIGLTRGFMYAGASSVVASLWKVDDEATAELMKLFYTNMLQGGMRPTEALRAAQNTIRQNPNWSSPYYWAAFTLQGDFREGIKAKHAEVGSTRSLVIIAVGLLILLSGMYLSHRRMRASLNHHSTVKK
jgi:CHAT domain-containing protein/tetratricopeptide (TPR) repeat protein